MKHKFFRFFPLFAFFFLLHCSAPTQHPLLGGHPATSISPAPNAPHLAIPLSRADQAFVTCPFKPETRIAHFPMYHFPPSGQYNDLLKEKVIKSQFQLLHTILMYHPHIAIFDERITTNDYGPETFRRLQNQGKSGTNYTRHDGRIFNLQERFNTAQNLFHTGVPQYYELLGELQKDYLFNTGGPLTLYFLGYIPRLHKVIDYRDLRIVMDQITSKGGVAKFFKASSNQRDYYVYDFREEKLFFQVTEFFNLNPSFRGLTLISYGALHDLKDDFQGYLFEEGSSCLDWDSTSLPLYSAFSMPFFISQQDLENNTNQ